MSAAAKRKLRERAARKEILAVLTKAAEGGYFAPALDERNIVEILEQLAVDLVGGDSRRRAVTSKVVGKFWPHFEWLASRAAREDDFHGVYGLKGRAWPTSSRRSTRKCWTK